jgi:hypothetical protein
VIARRRRAAPRARLERVRLESRMEDYGPHGTGLGGNEAKLGGPSQAISAAGSC